MGGACGSALRASHCAVAPASRWQPPRKGAARAAANVAAMDLGGCPVPLPRPSLARRPDVPHPRGPRPKKTSGPGVLGDPEWRPALALAALSLGQRFPSPAPVLLFTVKTSANGCEVGSPENRRALCTCFGRCWAGLRLGTSERALRSHLLNIS